MVLAAALLLYALPVGAFAANTQPQLQRVLSVEELTDGGYVLMLPQGYAPTVLQEDWILAAYVSAGEAGVSAPADAVWQIQLQDGAVILRDSTGTPLSPGEDGENGIRQGLGFWSVACSDGFFSFHSVSGAERVTLAANESVDHCFRAYRDSTVSQDPEAYPCQFALYRVEQPQQEPAPPTEEAATQPTAQTEPDPNSQVPTATPTESVQETTEVVLSPTEPILAETEPTQPALIPEAVCITPAEGRLAYGDTVTLSCPTQGAQIFYALSEDGETYTEAAPYSTPFLPGACFGSVYVKAFAQLGETCGPESEGIFTRDVLSRWNLYFGQLHAHSNISDGYGTAEEAYAHAAGVPGLDFFALTDHSNSFDNALSGCIGADGQQVSEEWAAGKAAAAAVTGDDFVGIFGYEMTWQEDKRLGHINTFATPGFASREQEPFSDRNAALEAYYEALCAVPGSIGQFNHPGEYYGDFQNFAYLCPEYDNVMTLLEVGGEGGFTAYAAYIRALDLKWHVAPTNNQNNHNGSWGDANRARTVVLAEELTETAIYDAMRHYRVYATQDEDLRIGYQLNGSCMGSVLPVSSAAEIHAAIWDPTDSIGSVAVIADGGQVLAERWVEGDQTELTFSLPGSYSYYFLRVTQPDGDIAVTAPVWLDQAEDMGIADFSADAAVPVQDQPLTLTLELYNREAMDFLLESVCFTVDERVIETVSQPGTLAGGETATFCVPYTYPGLGVTEFTAVVTGTVAGQSRSYTRNLTLRYRMEDAVTAIAVDDLHGGEIGIENLTAIAAGKQISVGYLSGAGQTASEQTADLLEKVGLLVIPCPETGFSPEFLTMVTEFVKNGGNVIACGASSQQEDGATQMNRLLESLGVSLRLTSGNFPEVGGAPYVSQTVNSESAWCEEIAPEQCYYQHSGCAVDIGSGTWLVRGSAALRSDAREAPVMLACQDTGFGGTVFVSGGAFLSDGDMPRQDNYWDPSSINQSIVEHLLNIQRREIPLTDIAAVRTAEPGAVFRIRGFVTVGTSNPNNTFPDTLYLQDDTGGIAVISFTQAGVEMGTPMEIIGYRSQQGENPALELIDFSVADEPFYRYVPRTGSCADAMDYAVNGGRIMEVEGRVVDVEYTPDGAGVRRFALRDAKGDLAQVWIEEGIFAGSTGKNTLASQVKMGKTVRAMGILHLDEAGNPVLRVRNCEEVVYVPPIVTPDTGDSIPVYMTMLIISIALLAAAAGKKKTRRS